MTRFFVLFIVLILAAAMMAFALTAPTHAEGLQGRYMGGDAWASEIGYPWTAAS